jgi:DNA invertase Pin-like site-specific DNA recombinase
MTVWRPPGYFDPLAYKQTIAYGRYSSLRQGHGQSEDRQHEELEKVLKLFGWRLLDQYFDKGVSAGRGKHRVIGVLSRLLKRIHRREIPLPCVLTIECFDRLTREELTVAQELFLSLINRGMAVFTTMDQAGYDKASINGNPGLLYGSIGMYPLQQPAQHADHPMLATSCAGSAWRL